MDATYEQKMKDLENKSPRSPLEDAAFNALLAMDERQEELDNAKAGTTPPPVDPVTVAQSNLDAAKQVADAALAAVDAANSSGGTGTGTSSTPPATPAT